MIDTARYLPEDAMAVRALPVLEQPDVVACCAPLRSRPLDTADATALAGRFAALGDPVRLRLLSLLASEGEAVCACDLVEPAGRSQPTVSHHLKILREAGLVTSERRGVNIWYAAVPAALEVLRDALGPAART
jgi:ArsR family transcriptional regulator, arsenate/arsenite/antimonite-responsive transcriptional repressor